MIVESLRLSLKDLRVLVEVLFEIMELILNIWKVKCEIIEKCDMYLE